MTFHRRQQPDPFEVLLMARSRVFVRCGADNYLIVSALRNSTCLMCFCKGDSEMQSVRYFDPQPDLFDGSSWDLPALIQWLESISPDNDSEEQSE